ncbi:MAG: VanZ family protein [marine benthic group bacterium]|jgi:VanZ family protein|nr:VanZ family protein [Candidatus Benthicola marisminoris]
MVWAALILVATTIPLADTALRTSIPWADKAVHLVLYLVLGGLVGAALSAGGHTSAGAWAAALLGLLVFAAMDEAHQHWLPHRVASVSDWIADVVGATVGLAAGMLLGTDTRPPRAGEERTGRHPDSHGG